MLALNTDPENIFNFCCGIDLFVFLSMYLLDMPKSIKLIYKLLNMFLFYGIFLMFSLVISGND